VGGQIPNDSRERAIAGELDIFADFPWNAERLGDAISVVKVVGILCTSWLCMLELDRSLIGNANPHCTLQYGCLAVESRPTTGILHIKAAHHKL
jgi:hypothetical protein